MLYGKFIHVREVLHSFSSCWRLFGTERWGVMPIHFKCAVTECAGCLRAWFQGFHSCAKCAVLRKVKFPVVEVPTCGRCMSCTNVPFVKCGGISCFLFFFAWCSKYSNRGDHKMVGITTLNLPEARLSKTCYTCLGCVVSMIPNSSNENSMRKGKQNLTRSTYVLMLYRLAIRKGTLLGNVLWITSLATAASSSAAASVPKVILKALCNRIATRYGDKKRSMTGKHTLPTVVFFHRCQEAR